MYFVDFNLRRDKHLLSAQNLELEDELGAALEKLNFLEKYAFSELFHGSFDNHNFYISKQKNSIADIEDMNNILYFFGDSQTLRKKLENDVETINDENPTVLSKQEFEISTFANHGKFPISFLLNNSSKYFLSFVLEGKTSTAELLTKINEEHGLSGKQIMSELKTFYENISRHDIFLLRDKNVKDIDVLRNFMIFRF